MPAQHKIDYTKDSIEWGRGIYHVPTKTVHIWPESDCSHYRKAMNLGYDTENDCEGLYVSPYSGLLGKGWEVTLTGSFYDTAVYDKDELIAILDGLGFDTKYL
jgi:hypothetical protein